MVDKPGINLAMTVFLIQLNEFVLIFSTFLKKDFP